MDLGFLLLWLTEVSCLLLLFNFLLEKDLSRSEKRIVEKYGKGKRLSKSQSRKNRKQRGRHGKGHHSRHNRRQRNRQYTRKRI